MATVITSKCQYWSVNEPYPCVYWDSTNAKCIYTSTVENATVTPARAPYCNFIGTAVGCDYYVSSSPGNRKACCILPDPLRHVCNRWTGNKWIAPEADDSGNIIKDDDGNYTIDFSVINGYNDGACDGTGTDTTCSGFSPQHMGFGRLVPTDDSSTDIDTDGTLFSPLSDFDLRLPLHFVLYNLRAKLSKCKWWNGDYVEFKINSDTMLVELDGDWLCNCTDDTSAYSNFSTDTGAPCNGCKESCPNYTGICWKYCTDDLTSPGQPVLAEQIHELRYYQREQNWTTSAIANYFADEGYIYTWKGSKTKTTVNTTDSEGNITSSNDYATLKGTMTYTINSNNQIEEYKIPSIKTYMDDFDTLDINHTALTLTQGTSTDADNTTFPTLVRELTCLNLGPIVKNMLPTDGIFEMSDLNDNNILLYGKIFNTSYEVHAANITQSDIISLIPNQVFEYENLTDIQLALGTTAYTKFCNKFKAAMKTIEYTKPDLWASNMLDDASGSFAISLPLLFPGDLTKVSDYDLGTNLYLVYQEIGDDIVFTKFPVVRSVIAGALIQTDFSVEGDDVAIKEAYDYTASFYINVNNNGSMTFKFYPIIYNSYKPEYSHLYNDFLMAKEYGTNEVAPDKPIMYAGCYTYKLIQDPYIVDSADESSTEIRPLGGDGYVLISLSDTRVTSIIKDWEYDSLTFYYDDDSTCEMTEVYRGQGDGLYPNQIIVKPKDTADYKSLCSPVVEFENLTVYEKYSFDDSPDVADTNWEAELYEDDSYEYSYGKSKADVTLDVEDQGDITFENFQYNLVPSLVIVNREGRPFTLFRTKALGWVKQPKCPDVEIYYNWSANYVHWKNYPVCWCCGTWSMHYDKTGGYTYVPPCGDHDLNSTTGRGPMWWPYVQCSTYAIYEIISNLDNYSYDVIGLFKEEDDDGNKTHGDHDMRMLGPSTNIAYHGRGCNFLLRCTCDWRTFNAIKKSDSNTFIGWGRIRGNVSDTDIADWNDDGDTLPGFGNVNRPQLNSYLTMDKWQYQYSADSGSTWDVAWQLMPAFMTFSRVDFLDTSVDPVWDYGASDDGPPVVNPLGFLRAKKFETVSVPETVNSTTRYTFDQIFHCRATTDLLRYPSSTSGYTTTRKEGKVYPWYEFKQDPMGEGTIQWAWQERWQPLVRAVLSSDAYTSFYNKFLDGGISALSTSSITVDGSTVNAFGFLDIDYPEYKYNYKNREFELVVTEGDHKIMFVAPEKDEYTGEYKSYIGIKLDSGGMLRGISWEGGWLTEDNTDDSISVDLNEFNVDLYAACVGDGSVPDPDSSGNIIMWTDEVTLFDSTCTGDDEADAEDADHMIQSYSVIDDTEYVKKTYYQTGLKVTLDSSSFNSYTLPMEISAVLGNSSEQNATSATDFTSMVSGGGATSSITVDFDDKLKTISGIEITYLFGSELIDAATDDTSATYKYYHRPAFTVYAVDDEGASTTLYEVSSMSFYTGDSESSPDTVTDAFTWSNDFDYIYKGTSSIKVVFRSTPTDDETSDMSSVVSARFTNSLNMCSFKVYEVYEEVLTDAYEAITTWQRMYYISYADVDNPPQGTDPENTNTLYNKSYYKSTVYNRDTDDGVLNMDGSSGSSFYIASKTSARQLYNIYVDGTALSGDVAEMEGKQKELFDASIAENTESMTMTIAMPPTFSTYLTDINATMSMKSTSFSLSNTLLNSLAAINSFDRMNGEGYLYEPSEPFKSGCDKQGPCGTKQDATFYYNFVGQDSNADSSKAGVGYSSALTSYYGGTYSMQLRTEAAEALMANTYAELYGASTASQIWVDEAESSLSFVTLSPDYVDTSVTTSTASYNLEYFAYAKSWVNAYFNTASNYVGTSSVTEVD